MVAPLCIIGAVTLVAACSSGGSASPSGSGASSPTTISVAIGGNPPPAAALAAFKAQTGITVKWINLGWDDIQTKISASATSSTYFADVVDVDWSRVGTYRKLGWMLPLNGRIDLASVQADLPQLPSFTVGGQTVGVPFDTSFTVTTVNKKCFAKAGITTMPTTIDQYTSDLKTIKDKGASPAPLDIPFAAAEGLSTYWYTVTANFGGKILDAKYQPQFTSPASAGYRALQWMVQALKDGLVPAGNINDTDVQGQQGEMAHGQVCSVFSDYSGGVATTYDVPSTSTVVGQAEYIPTPGEAINLNNPDGMGIPKTAEHPAAAAKFISWFIGAGNQANWAGLNGSAKAISGFTLPARLSALTKLVSNQHISGGQQLVQMVQHSAQPVFPDGAPPWYPQFSNAVYTNIHAAATGQLSVAAAIQAIAHTVDQLNQNGS